MLQTLKCFSFYFICWLCGTSEDDLMDLFSKYGDVSQVHIVVDKDTKRSKGIGYVHYVHPESAAR